MPFAESDLNLPQAQIDQIKAHLANTGQENAFVLQMTEAEGKVDDFTRGYDVADTLRRRLWRALVNYQLWALLQSIPPAVESAYKEAMQELTDIRDGRFPHLPRKTPATDTGLGRGNWGGADKIGLRA
ncbi:MAG TPA: hypothetical protein VNO52_00340 [Methylomirabilota bacterium]|nr:hypothetical protein [Methylomirabilota bacterium]